jgi:predicted oxidoreductase (fatty acid repression mutant protein)
MSTWLQVPRTRDFNSAFNTQGSRLTIVVVQSGAVKIYVAVAAAAVEALRQKERQDETQFTTKIDCFRMKLSLPPKLMVF